MDQISNSKRTEEEKEKGKTEKPLRGLYVLYTVVSKHGRKSLKSFNDIDSGNEFKRSLAPLRNAKKKRIEISFLFICLKVENEVKKPLRLF